MFLSIDHANNLQYSFTMPPDPYMSQQKTIRRNERRRADYQRKRDAAHCMNQLTDFLITLTRFSSNWCS